MQAIINLYTETFGTPPSHVSPLAKAGSNRQYVRMTNNEGDTIIGVIGTSPSENNAFIYLANHFRAKGLNVPSIIAVDTQTCCYLQTDLGAISLYQALQDGRDSGHYQPHHKELLSKTIRQLAHLQITGAQDLDFNQLLSPTTFNQEAALFDLNYFKYCFLKATDLPYDEVALEKDLKAFAQHLTESCNSATPSFLYRDFQTRNVMLLNGEPYFIDFQGGMQGPFHYDVASLLWQASAKYPESLREELVEIYLDELSTLIPIDRELFKQQLKEFVLFRTLQVLGAYGLRGYFEQKPYFLNSIPPALNNLKSLLEAGIAHAFPYLEDVLLRLVKLKSTPCTCQKPLPTAATNNVPQEIPKLKVRIYSFSYKKSGIPIDESGNGGGYVFDCRSTHNPGKYAPYKSLTGLDQPVIDFLEKDGEILQFLKSVYRLAEFHVERYIERGFTDLMFSFGCTGGQHRSVYSAQHLAEHLHKKYGIHISLEHKEQSIQQEFLPKLHTAK